MSDLLADLSDACQSADVSLINKELALCKDGGLASFPEVVKAEKFAGEVSR